MNPKHIRERRIFMRRPIKTKVVFEDEFGDGLFFVYSKDISMGGIYLASSIPMRVGTMLFLSFALPSYKRPIKITGEVVRIMEDADKKTKGMGIRFLGLSETAQKRLSKFLSS